MGDDAGGIDPDGVERLIHSVSVLKCLNAEGIRVWRAECLKSGETVNNSSMSNDHLEQLERSLWVGFYNVYQNLVSLARPSFQLTEGQLFENIQERSDILSQQLIQNPLAFHQAVCDVHPSNFASATTVAPLAMVEDKRICHLKI
jgi:hypothetical protein